MMQTEAARQGAQIGAGGETGRCWRWRGSEEEIYKGREGEKSQWEGGRGREEAAGKERKGGKRGERGEREKEGGREGGGGDWYSGRGRAPWWRRHSTLALL